MLDQDMYRSMIVISALAEFAISIGLDPIDAVGQERIDRIQALNDVIPDADDEISDLNRRLTKEMLAGSIDSFLAKYGTLGDAQ